MIEYKSTETINEEINGEEVNFDRYDFVERTLLSTKEVSIVVDFKNEEITGDCVAYGDWYDLDFEECTVFIDHLNKHNLATRDFSSIYEKEIQNQNEEKRILEIRRNKQIEQER